jgi:hypothetical protein
MSFKISSPDGDRVISFVGTLSGDEITFVREVDVKPGGSRGGAALFGASGARTFTARRSQ